MSVLALFTVSLVANLAIWLILYRGFATARSDQSKPGRTPAGVSIIVAVRNEEENIRDLLNCLLSQTVDGYEVIISDDHSEDRTVEIASLYQAQHRNLVVLQAAATPAGKKHALARGIDAASNEFLLFTDADCRPATDWAASLAARFDDDPCAVIGYSPFEDTGPILSKCTRYETFITGFLTAAAVGMSKPYMAVGRNMAYTRSAFEAVGGFENIMHSMSGDDDLMVQQFSMADVPVRHAFGDGSIVPTAGPTTWSSWLKQKLRHTSAARYYRVGVSASLLLFHLTGLVLYLAPFLLGWTGLLFFGLGTFAHALILSVAAREFGERDLLAWQPVLHVVYTAYIWIVAPLGALFKPRKW